MLRLLSIATVLMIALCIIISASIALAEESAPAQPAAGSPEAEAPAIEAIEPDRRMIDYSLAEATDIYEFDFVVAREAGPHPEFIEPSDIQDI